MKTADLLQESLRERNEGMNSRSGAGIPVIVLAIVAGLGVLCIIGVLVLQYLEYSYYEEAPSVWVKPGEVTRLPPMPSALPPVAPVSTSAAAGTTVDAGPSAAPATPAVESTAAVSAGAASPAVTGSATGTVAAEPPAPAP